LLDGSPRGKLPSSLAMRANRSKKIAF